MNIKFKALAIALFMVFLAFSACGGGGGGSSSGTTTDDGGGGSDTSAPIPGTAISFTGIGSKSLSVNWGAATDNITVQSNLKYKLVKASASTAIDTSTEANAITNTDMIMDWTTASVSCVATGLTAGTAYYFAVLVKDEAENIALYTPTNETTKSSPIWAKSVTFTGTFVDDSEFYSINTDSSGNIYAAGYIYSTGTNGSLNFGNNITISGDYGHKNVLLVKYNSDGLAQWAKSTEYGDYEAVFKGVKTDSSGNVYAVGYITGIGEVYSFGNGKTVTCIDSSNLVIVKYNSDGVAQWANCVTATTPSSRFNSVTVDSSGNVYAVGEIYGKNEYSFGNSKTATATSSSYNAVIVKYDSNGNALWAKTTMTGSGTTQDSEFYSICADSSGNIYTAGYIYSAAPFYFGSTVYAQASYGASNHVVIVKYGTDGNAIWARSESSSDGLESKYYSVATDSSGNVYAAGYIHDNDTYLFNNSITVSPSVDPYEYDTRVVLVKYNSGGFAQWAQSVDGAYGYNSLYNSVCVDSSNNIYAAGYISNTSFNFGNSITSTGAQTGYNAVLIQYDTSGNAQSQKTFATATTDSLLYSVTADSSGNVYSAGYIYGTGTFEFSNSVTVAASTAASLYNVVLIKY